METTTKSGKILHGIVVKSAMKDTATVAVERFEKHPKYDKYQKKTKKFLVHDAGNEVAVGTKVAIREIPPMSKRKHFEIVK